MDCNPLSNTIRTFKMDSDAGILPTLCPPTFEAFQPESGGRPIAVLMSGKEAITALKHWADANLRYEYLAHPVDRRNGASRRIPESLFPPCMCYRPPNFRPPTTPP